MKNKVDITVMCTCYNHKKYIRDTFDGIINQKTEYVYKIFVYDDLSTDGSQDIIKEYADKYPDIFDVYLSKKNMYNEKGRREFLRNLYLSKMEGRYIAICECDDYWIDENKLQKQIDFMDNHPDCAMSVHASKVIDCESGTTYERHNCEKSRYMTADEIILDSKCPAPSTASFVYRAKDYEIPDYLYIKHVGDITRRLYSMLLGGIYYFDDVMSVYRYKHSGGWSSIMSIDHTYAMRHYADMIHFWNKFNEHTNRKYESLINLRKICYLYTPMLLDANVSMTEYNNILYTDGDLEWLNEFNGRYKDAICRIGSIIRLDYSFDENERSLLEKKSHLLIFGCGDYSEYIKNLLNKKNIGYDGYLVTHDQEYNKLKHGKNVWGIKQYPFDFEDTTVIIGLGMQAYYDVKKVLEQNNIRNVIAGMWIDI